MKFELRLQVEVPDKMADDITLNRVGAAAEFQDFVNHAVAMSVETWYARRSSNIDRSKDESVSQAVANDDASGYVTRLVH